MRINVASANPAKLEAVRGLLTDYPPFADAEVIAYPVSSSVSEQPLTLEETVVGARNRAKAAFVDCTYSIGIESGMFEVPFTRTGYMNVTFAVIFDGENYAMGGSPLFEYPLTATHLVLEGEHDMSAALKELGYTDKEKVGYEEGCIGMLTKGRMTRAAYARYAVQMALTQLENAEWF